jgi:hypothetical protein
MMEVTKVSEIIEAAFLDVERDNNCTLHQAELIDHSPEREVSDAEWQHAKDIDQETDWRRVPAAALDECGAAMSHATPKSWRFYLPAYMRRALSLLDAHILETWLPGSIIHHLTYSNDPAGQGLYSLERFTTLTSAQGDAVKGFLEYVRDYPAPRTSYGRAAELALRKYWGLNENDRPQGPGIVRP